jgi:ferrous iron transport protein B
VTTPTSAERTPRGAPDDAARPNSTPLVLLLGNPNTGKTTLFNRLTGENARIGNYPGITVERRSGRLKGSETLKGTSRGASEPAIELVDAPGTYSLAARSPEEQLALWSALGMADHPRPDLCVCVVDAGQLARNLYLVLQVLELGQKTVIALNMIDEVTSDPPSPSAVSELFGVPCVATDARRGSGMLELTQVIERAHDDSARPSFRLPYPAALEQDLTEIAAQLPAEERGDRARERALALWALSSIESDDELEGIDPELRAACLAVRARAGSRDIDREIIATRYAFIDQHLPRLVRRSLSHPPKRKTSERIDRVLLHPLYGFLIFVSLMLVVFQALFSWSDPAIRLVELTFAGLDQLTTRVLPAGVLHDLVSKGVIGGVGNVVVFLPQILLLFFFIGILEDSGYMARVAFLMDRIMKALGLHGRAFVPMLSGFACAVPAILATRTMEQRRDRLLTMLVIPLMTCSARLPVYTLIIAALFPPTRMFGWLPVQGLLMIAMYLFSVLITLLAAGVLGRTVVKGRRIPLILELPPYRLPSLRGTLKMMWQRAASFLREAGTVILVCTIALWALLSFPRNVHTTSSTTTDSVQVSTRPAQVLELPAAHAPTPIEQSYGGRLGKAIEPALKPLGFDWRIGVGLIGAFAAREVFVSTLGLVFGIGDADEHSTPLRERIQSERGPTGHALYTPLAGLSLMIFFALSCQCMSTLAVVYRETKKLSWPAFMFVYMTSAAYVASLLVYQGGRLLGF